MPDAGYEVNLSPEELKQYVQYRRQRDVFGRDGPPESDFRDRQLQKAIDYLLEELGEKTKATAS